MQRRWFGWALALTVLASVGLAGTALADSLARGGVGSLPSALSTPLTTASIAVSTTVPVPAPTVPVPASTVRVPATTVPVPTTAASAPGITVPTPPLPVATVPSHALPPPPSVPLSTHLPPPPSASVSVSGTATSTNSAAATVKVAGTGVAVRTAASGSRVSVQTNTPLAPTAAPKVTARVATPGSGPSLTLAPSPNATLATSSSFEPAASRPAQSRANGTGIAGVLPAVSQVFSTPTSLGVPSAAVFPTALSVPVGRIGSSPAGDDPILASLLGAAMPLAGAATASGAGAAGAPLLAEVVATPEHAHGMSSVLHAHRDALIGGFAALAALLGLGLGALSRPSASLGACAELLRFPFPRFRVLPCPHIGHAASVVNSGSPTAPLSAHPRVAGAHAEHPSVTQPPVAQPHAERPLLPSSPQFGGLPAAGLSVSHPWELLRTVVLAMLAAANAVLFVLRRKVGRPQSD